MPDNSIAINPATTALVVIDLQKGIVGRDTAPHTAKDVVTRCAVLADRFRAVGASVVLVHVSFGADGQDRLKQPIDDPAPSGSNPPAGWDEIVPELGPRSGDLVVTKRQWGAFYGTGLDLQLRRRGIDTIVIGGIATNFGVESTARDAWERNYAVIFAEDAMSGLSEAAHSFAVKTIFPRIGRIRSTERILAGLRGDS